jgi:PAS domain S-box-containing protein
MFKRPIQTISRLVSAGAGLERNDRLGALVAIVTTVVLLGLDIALGREAVLAGAFIVVPFLAALWAGVVVTTAVGMLAVAAGVASSEWADLSGPDYRARIALLVIGGLFAVATAWARERVRAGSRRLELLNDVGAIADGSLPLGETLERLLDVIVPGFADFCLVDAIHERRVLRSAVRVAGRDDAPELERFLRNRSPSVPEWMLRPEAPFPRHPRFIPRFTDEDIRRLAHDEQDLERLRGLGARSSITVSMIARDHVLGALTLNTAWSGRRYTLEDVRFAQALAGRVALVLDNAGLFSDLESVERRMDNVMSILDEAVVIQDAHGELVYANPAAAGMMGFSTTEEVASSPTSDGRDRFEIRTEDGELVTPQELVGRQALAGRPVEPRVLRSINRDDGSERWLITRAKPMLGPDGRALYSVTAIEDVTEVKRAEFAQRLLARVGELLASSTDYQRMLHGLAALTVPEFADWCTVNVPSADGTIEQVAVAHTEADEAEALAEERRREPLRITDDDPIALALRTRAPAIAETPGDDGARMVVPMSAGGRGVGVLVFGNAPGSRRFHREDMRLATEIGRRAGIAVDNARLAEERAEVARVLQEGLMPRALPHMPGWETAAVYQPAGEVNAVGGDFYDAFEIDRGWMVLVGDVMGRGAAAASLTALARHTIRTAGVLTGDPCRALELLNEALLARGDTALCTAAILILPRAPEDPATIEIVAAGHPLPLLVRGGEIAEAGRPGPLLGAFAASDWEPASVKLRAGDQLILYTDGVIEARGESDRFGEERLRAELAAADRPLAAIGRVTAALESFLGDEPDDDVAMIAIRRTGTPRFTLRGGAQDGERSAVSAPQTSTA